MESTTDATDSEFALVRQAAQQQPPDPRSTASRRYTQPQRGAGARQLRGYLDNLTTTTTDEDSSAPPAGGGRAPRRRAAAKPKTQPGKAPPPAGGDLDVTEAAEKFTSHLIKERSELEARNKRVAELQTHLESQREHIERELEERLGAERKAMEDQRQEYEAVIKRHLTFIDRFAMGGGLGESGKGVETDTSPACSLIHDKKELSTKCEELVKELQGENGVGLDPAPCTTH